MAPLRCLFDSVIEMRLSGFVGIEKIFQNAARSRFKVFAISPDLPPPLTLLGFEPAKHDSAPIASGRLHFAYSAPAIAKAYPLAPASRARLAGNVWGRGGMAPRSGNSAQLRDPRTAQLR